MAFGKKNQIVINPFKYNIGLIGEGGIGKTTVIYEACKKFLGNNGEYLFVECGKEDGQEAIAGINYIGCKDWNGTYDELNNTVGFRLLVEDIIKNKNTEYPTLQTLVIDTYDQLREIAVNEVLRMHNEKNPRNQVKTIKSAFGGFMAGDDMADDIILDNLWRLKEVGVHFIIIGHVKNKDITDAATGDVYTQLTTDMPMRSFNKIKTKLHFLGVASVDRDVIKERKGKKDIKTIKSETRKITFRDDNYALDSKSRFADIVNEIPLNADAFLKALTDAIEAEAKKGEVSIEDLKKNQEEKDAAVKQRAEEISNSAQLSQNSNDGDELKNLKKDIIEHCKRLGGSSNLEMMSILKEYVPSGNPNGLTEIPKAKELLSRLETM